MKYFYASVIYDEYMDANTYHFLDLLNKPKRKLKRFKKYLDKVNYVLIDPEDYSSYFYAGYAITKGIPILKVSNRKLSKFILHPSKYDNYTKVIKDFYQITLSTPESYFKLGVLFSEKYKIRIISEDSNDVTKLFRRFK